MPKVSVIMGVYNVGNGEKLKVAIDSILQQTFKDFEVIICEDGSRDNTYKIIKEIAQKDKRIKIIKNDGNKGLAYTLNHCLKEVNGKYIARMDDDDYSYPNRLEKQVKFLDENPKFDIVSSAIDIFDGEKVTSKQCVRSIEVKKEDFLWGNCFVHPATMFRKEAILSVDGYRIAKETRRAEDYDLFMRMYANGSKGYNIEEALLRYYVNPIAMKKRKYRFRIDEMIVRFKGYRILNYKLFKYVYVFKPIFVGLLPKKILLKVQKKYYE